MQHLEEQTRVLEGEINHAEPPLLPQTTHKIPRNLAIPAGASRGSFPHQGAARTVHLGEHALWQEEDGHDKQRERREDRSSQGQAPTNRHQREAPPQESVCRSWRPGTREPKPATSGLRGGFPRQSSDLLM
jgi:hypothetical protein